MEFIIRPLDLDSEADLAQYESLTEALDLERFGALDIRTPSQVKIGFLDTPYKKTRALAVMTASLEGGEVMAAAGSVQFPQTENLGQAYLNIATHPAYRGQGMGTALADEFAALAHEGGREHLTAFAEIPADGDPNDPGLPVNRLAARLGMTRRGMAVCRSAGLPVPADRLDALEAEAAPRHDGYRILTWQDRTPEEHLRAVGTVQRQLDIDDPDEDTENEPTDYTPERIRHDEQRMQNAGQHKFVSMAFAPDGSPAAHSEVWYRNTPGTTMCWQENTLVMPDHRGHSLGLALKVVTHRYLSEHRPALTRIVTWNSHVNPWMISINEKLGYTVVEREITFQS